MQVVGESGLFTPDDIAYVQEAGVKAVSLQIENSMLDVQLCKCLKPQYIFLPNHAVLDGL